MLHRRRRFSRDGGLRHRRITAQNTSINDNLFPRMHRNDVPGTNLLHRHLALDLAARLAVDQPNITLSE